MIKQKMSLGFLSNILVMSLNLIATLFVARIAGPTVLGTLAFGLAFVHMFSFIGSLGLGGAHTKIMNENLDGYTQADCTTTYSVLHSSTKILMMTVIIGYFFAQKYIFNLPFESKEHEYVITILMVMILLETFIEIPIANFSAKTEQAKRDIPNILRVLILSPTKIVIVLLGGTAAALALSNLFVLILIIPYYWYLFRNDRFGRFDWGLSKKYFAYGVPLIFYGISSSLSSTLDKVLLQYFTSSEQVGYYTAGFRVGSFFMMIGHTTGLIFFPYFSKAVSDGNISLIKSAIAKYEKFVLIFVMPLMLFFSIYADSLVLLVLGKQYTASIPVLMIINIALLIKLLVKPYGNVITGFGKFKLLAMIHIFSIIVLVSFMFLSINPAFLDMKATGAAMAFLIAQIFLAVCYKLFAKRRIAELSYLSNIYLVLFGILIYISFSIFYQRYFTVTTTSRMVFPLIYFVVVYSSLWISKQMGKKDLKLLWSLFSTNKMKNYIKSEFNTDINRMK